MALRAEGHGCSSRTAMRAAAAAAAVAQAVAVPATAAALSEAALVVTSANGLVVTTAVANRAPAVAAGLLGGPALRRRSLARPQKASGEREPLEQSSRVCSALC